MPDHLSIEQREQLLGCLRTTCDYIAEFADDAALFMLLGTLQHQAGQLAQCLNQQHYMTGPGDMAEQMSVAQRLRQPDNGRLGPAGAA